MLFLIINPEYDYEMFHDGDTRTCVRGLERRIYEGKNADDAILNYIEKNGFDVNLKTIENIIALRVDRDKCETVSKELVERIKERELQQKNSERQQIQEEIHRLQNKLKEI